jgi:methylamine dehydrogenase accessory protein MauD
MIVPAVVKLIEFALLTLRLLLAAVFLLAGATKLIDPRGTRRALRDFGVPRFIVTPMVLLLPLLEIAVAVALIPASLAWYGAWGALALLAVFLLAVGIAMLRGRKPDCHCFGQIHSAPVGWQTLVRNVVLAAGAGALLYRGPGKSGPDVWTWIATLGETGQKVAFVAGLAVAFVFFRLLNAARPESQSIASQLSSPVDEEEAEEEEAPVQRHTAKPRPQPRPAPAGPVARGIGFPIGTPAPEFELPDLNGEKRSLQSLRAQGRNVLLIFLSPFCKPCQAMLPNLVRWMGEIEQPPNIVLISRGAAQDNLAKLKDFEPSRILLQRGFEVATAYDCDATPAAVLVGADGLIRSPLAVEGRAIKQLLHSSSSPDSFSARQPPSSEIAFL